LRSTTQTRWLPPSRRTAPWTIPHPPARTACPSPPPAAWAAPCTTRPVGTALRPKPPPESAWPPSAWSGLPCTREPPSPAAPESASRRCSGSLCLDTAHEPGQQIPRPASIPRISIRARDSSRAFHSVT
jgi:hypothetical protein